jgi:hypothetical protein
MLGVTSPIHTTLMPRSRIDHKYERICRLDEMLENLVHETRV